MEPWAGQSLWLLGAAAGWVLDWWWLPVLGPRRGSLSVVGLTGCAGALLGAVVATPILMDLVATIYSFSPGSAVLLIAAGLVLGLLVGLQDSNLPARHGGNLRRRTLAVFGLTLAFAMFV